MIKITKSRARKLYNEGVTIHLLPSNVCWSTSQNSWIRPTPINTNKDVHENRPFDTWINEFEYYNCDHQRGYYTHYYIAE